MGRYFNPAAGQQRRKTVRVPESNPSIPVPWWARNGKGVVRVTGCGAGASGNVAESASSANGGGGGAYAVNHTMLIPAGVTTLAAVLGIGGPSVTANVATPGNPGGTTSLTVGALTLRLNGGGNGQPASANNGGVATTDGTASAFVQGAPGPSLGWVGGSTSAGTGIGSGPSTVATGATGGSGTQSGGYANGGASPWGIAAPVRTGNLVNGASGADAAGFGAGGQGVLVTAGGAAATSGNGSHGFLEIEFVEVG